MRESVCPPQRMRYSLESRCRIVQLILGGESPQAAAAACGASRATGDRLARNRRAGWQYLHLAIDDHSRLAYCELLPSESPADCVAFLRRAVAWYAEHGITIERVLSDNGNGYRSFAWRDACAELAIQR